MPSSIEADKAENRTEAIEACTASEEVVGGTLMVKEMRCALLSTPPAITSTVIAEELTPARVASLFWRAEVSSESIIILLLAVSVTRTGSGGGGGGEGGGSKGGGGGEGGGGGLGEGGGGEGGGGEGGK